MLVKDLRERVESIATILSDWGSRASDVADLRRLTELLAAHDTLTVAEFCSRVARANVSERNAGLSNRQASANDEVVSKYVGRLSSTGLDRLTLATLISDLKTDKDAKLAELSAIANQLSGADEKYKNKASALDKINEVIRRRLDTSRRLEGSSGIF